MSSQTSIVVEVTSDLANGASVAVYGISTLQGSSETQSLRPAPPRAARVASMLHPLCRAMWRVSHGAKVGLPRREVRLDMSGCSRSPVRGRDWGTAEAAAGRVSGVGALGGGGAVPADFLIRCISTRGWLLGIIYSKTTCDVHFPRGRYRTDSPRHSQPDAMAKTTLKWASKPVEIHCDMGEAFGNWTMGDDEAIMPHITSCSIACGFHAGDPMVMYKTVKAARRHGVRIGAHPSFLDLQGFGRREMKMDPVECEKMVIYQIGALKAFLDIEGIPLSHVSPHGALYGVMCKDKPICEAVCRAARHFTAPDGTPVPMIGASGTFMESVCAEMGIPFLQEVIADLEYDENGDCIISRTHEAVDLQALRSRLAGALRTGTIESKERKEMVDLKLGAAPLSLCIHSDTPGATEVAAATRQAVDDFNKECFS
ncbi:hypothetical protein Purlil1_1483 [Purpureocillium lilacinum]|uniref:Lactam utilization protein lamB n=1 Tax=Purpureocillium lilacinum TaxID=33203 RepID=A0ABR0CCQ6_PURLI|nr:hypothetical protein Purlil1_1483 [Purpureocillium lilacinum]